MTYEKNGAAKPSFSSLLKIRREDTRSAWLPITAPSTDLLLLISVIILALFGTTMVFSAGYAYASARYGDAWYFIKRQTVWLFLGLLTMLVASHIKPSFFKAIAPSLYITTLILLILVLIIGFVGNGAKRWISIGPITLQPSEIAKLTMVLMLARYFSEFEEQALDKRNKKNSFLYGTLFPVLIMLAVIVSVMLQKHLSCIIILGLIGILVILAAGINAKYISLCTALGASGVAALALFTDYTKERITVWQNPEAYKLTGGWQTLQGLMAIGSGGIFGLGLGNSLLKYSYVSEPANDMIFAILCEELGLLGAVFTVFLFAVLIFRGYTVALRSADVFSRITAFGITTKIAVQTLLNIAVVTNTIPNTGISLPFFSYGGSSLVMLFFEMGLLLSISRFAKIQK